MTRTTRPSTGPIAIPLLLAAVWIANPATAATLTVCASGCDHVLIQDAVDAATSLDTIDVGAGTYVENILVIKHLTIQGAGAGVTIVDGNLTGRVFVINDSTVNLLDMTIRNGNGGITSSGSNAILSVQRCEILDNEAIGSGGGILALAGQVVITSDTISGNSASYRGGGVASRGTAQITIEQSALFENSAHDAGGGVAALGGQVTITETLIADNGSRTGGGVFATGALSTAMNLTIQTSTIYSNGAVYYGGGVYGYGINGTTDTMRVTNSTVTSNHAYKDAGVTVAPNGTVSHSTIAFNVASYDCGGLCFGATLDKTIVTGNQPYDCALGTVVSLGYNLSSDASCGFSGATDLENTDPLLLPLADNGGPTRTHALSEDSPALDAAGVNCRPTDQRGVTRPQDGDGDGLAWCDIGAFEADAPLTLTLEADKATLSWLAVAGAAAYEVYRGEVAGLPDAGYGDCVSDADPNPGDTTFVDATIPDPGDGLFYLVAVAGTPGGPDVGTTSAGSPRLVATLCP